MKPFNHSLSPLARQILCHLSYSVSPTVSSKNISRGKFITWKNSIYAEETKLMRKFQNSYHPNSHAC
jgi:hypothetical protein